MSFLKVGAGVVGIGSRAFIEDEEEV